MTILFLASGTLVGAIDVARVAYAHFAAARTAPPRQTPPSAVTFPM